MSDMASTASTSALAEAHVRRDEDGEQGPRPQAGPLPPKRGEIGYRHDVHGVDATSGDERSSPTTASSQPASSNAAPLPARHPADRDGPSTSPSTSGSPSTPPGQDGEATSESVPSNSADPASNTTTTTTISPSDSTTDLSTRSKRSFISFLHLKRPHGKPLKVWGVSFTIWIRFFIQTSFIVGTIAGWAVIAVLMRRHGSAFTSSPTSGSNGGGGNNSNGGSGSGNNSNNGGNDSNNNNNNSDNSTMPDPMTSAVFVYVAFGIAVLAQLLFLERCIFRIRAERYMHLNPNSILPSHLQRPSAWASGSGSGGPRLAYAPWDRPPLPTYAAALAESGAGTGDVEDNVIAVAPPPAYGKTRGSTLLLAGFMSDQHREARRMAAQRDSAVSAVSAVSVRSWFSVRNGGPTVGNGERGTAAMARQERPDSCWSYKSHDSDWDETVNAARARALEETLDQLEQGTAPRRS